jgi:carboxyl-terminal processing protease
MKIFPSPLRSVRPVRLAGGLLLAGLALAAPLRAIEQHFTTPNSLSAEAATLMRLLEEDHYNRDAVHQSDYGEVVPDYMAALDGQHLFFLKSDKADFTARWDAKTLYANIAYLGNIDAAYEIYYVYQKRVEARVNWIFADLQRDFDLTTNETFALDRAKAEWPATPAAADELWHQRLKFELIAELLGKQTLPQAKEVVRKRYERMLKNLAELDGGDLAEMYLSTITALYDPHSDYMSAESFEDFGIQMKLELSGIGAMLEMKDDYCQVREVFPGGPADLGHLKPDDKIVSVAQAGGEPVEVIGMKLRKVVDMIRGPKGSKVRLVVLPANASDPSVHRQIVITRDLVKVNSARAHGAIFQVPDPAGKPVPLGVISLPEFYGPSDDPKAGEDNSSASEDVAKLIAQMKQAGVQGLVLDLRRNGGGYLGEAINLAGLFIPPGPVVQVKNYDGTKSVDSSDRPRAAYDGPLAVLEDRFSASASEIVIGALQNYGRAIVVGDSSTHGKGTVQTVVEMKNLLSRQFEFSDAKMGAAKITIQKFYLPNGSSTQLKGVVPDIVLPSIDDYLPLGESSLPHALIWDRTTTASFNGQPLDPKVLAPLRQDSQGRQSSLEEFGFLRKNIDWFKAREDQKQISLNLQDRRKQKQDDDAFKKQMDAERDRLAKADFPFKEYRVAPPPPPRIKPDKKAAGDEDDDEDALSTDDDAPYPKVDVPLRETLRVLDDAIDLGHDHEYWASDHAPLTIASKG